MSIKGKWQSAVGKLTHYSKDHIRERGGDNAIDLKMDAAEILAGSKGFVEFAAKWVVTFLPFDIKYTRWAGFVAGICAMHWSNAAEFFSDLSKFKQRDDLVHVVVRNTVDVTYPLEEAVGKKMVCRETRPTYEVLIPRKIFELVTQNPTAALDLNRAAWADSETILRQSNSQPDKDQIVFEYLPVSGRLNDTMSVVKVRVKDFSRQMGELIEKLSPDKNESVQIDGSQNSEILSSRIYTRYDR